MLRLAADPADAPRRMVSIATVADLLAVDRSTVRKLLGRGKLEGAKVGRVVRIYVDSVSAYQQGQRIGGEDAEAAPARRRATAQHREAVAFLDAIGAR
ncbi:MAG: helix-turn-helix domain-containing protein [Alphaproteobacteria bacterium]